MASHFRSEGVQCLHVPGNGVVREVTSHYRLQPPALFGDGGMHSGMHFLFHLLEFCSHPFLKRLPIYLEFSVPVFPTIVGETQEIESFRLSSAILPEISPGESSESDESSFSMPSMQAGWRRWVGC